MMVGCDRVAANGDVANKIGTYNLALVARAHGIPFYVCAPGSSIDRATADGDAITIEERDAEEITHAKGVGVAAPGAQAWNPAFDITPAHLVTGFITEFGVLRPPYRGFSLRFRCPISFDRSGTSGCFGPTTFPFE